VHGTVKLGLLKSKPAEDPAMVQMATSGLVRNSLFLASEVIKKSVTSCRISFSLDKVPFNGCRTFYHMDMGEPFGKASGRTLSARSTYIPDPCWNSLWVISSNSLNLSMKPPSEALKGGLPMDVSARETQQTTQGAFVRF